MGFLYLFTITEKGAQGINAASTVTCDDIFVTVGVKVHVKCRQKYTNKKNVLNTVKQTEKQAFVPSKRSARASTGPFRSISDCLFCGTEFVQASHNAQRSDSCVKTDSFVQTILGCCDSRKDEWSFVVKGRIEYFAADLHAADCVYHQACSVNFRTGRDIPQQYGVAVHDKRRKSGRPVNDEQDQAFVKICALLQSNDEEQFTISKLVHEMDRYLMDSDSVPYGNQYMKSKLKEKYGESIHISETGGFHGIVTMREKTDSILRSYFQNANEGDQESQKMAVIETAARLIKSEIKANVPPMRDVYPDASQLRLEPSLQFIPDSPRQMLNLLCVGNDTQRKVAAIGQCVVQAVRPSYYPSRNRVDGKKFSSNGTIFLKHLKTLTFG